MLHREGNPILHCKCCSKIKSIQEVVQERGIDYYYYYCHWQKSYLLKCLVSDAVPYIQSTCDSKVIAIPRILIVSPWCPQMIYNIITQLFERERKSIEILFSSHLVFFPLPCPFRGSVECVISETDYYLIFGFTFFYLRC